MSGQELNALTYQRARFATLLPRDRLYTRSHFWMWQQAEDMWRVGLTKFGSRLLGEIVDYGFELSLDAPLRLGQKVGWIEGFKCLTELVATVEGTFRGGNPALERDPSVVNQDPHGAGWLYTAQGVPDRIALDAEGYVRVLDGEIDRLLGQ